MHTQVLSISSTDIPYFPMSLLKKLIYLTIWLDFKFTLQ